MSKDFELTWFVEDGYVTGDRPKHLTITIEDFGEDMTPDAIERVIADRIEDEFRNEVSWSCSDIEDVAARIHEVIQAPEEGEGAEG